jgi:hypothetical protein
MSQNLTYQSFFQAPRNLSGYILHLWATHGSPRAEKILKLLTTHNQTQNWNKQKTPLGHVDKLIELE